MGKWVNQLRSQEEKMQIFNSKNENTLVLEVRGRLDALTTANLEEECDTWINKGEKDLLLDLGGVDYISSAGLPRHSVDRAQTQRRVGGSALLQSRWHGQRGVLHLRI